MSSNIAERPPLVLNTGRWYCTRCRQKRKIYTHSDTGLNICPVCGERAWSPEWNPEALAEAARRQGEA
jgi:uncharacterized Zn finger protein (UPF0148 family)